MKKNIGTIDIVIRLVIAALIAILFYMGTISGVLGIILLILAGVFVLTSIIGFCPLYIPFKINTRKKD